MNLSIGTHTYPWAFGSSDPELSMDLSQLLDQAVEFQCHGVQIADNHPLHKMSESSLIAFKENAHNKGIAIEVGVRGMMKDQVIRYLDIADKLNAAFLRVVIDNGDFQPSKREVIQLINSLVPLFRAKEIVLAIENHDRFSSCDLANIISCTNEQWVGICLDTANSIGTGEGINEVLSHLCKHTVNLHIKDLIFRRLSHNMGFIINGCPAGQGDLNLPYIIGEVIKNGRLKSILLEVWSDKLETEKKTILRERQWAGMSIDYLKTLAN